MDPLATPLSSHQIIDKELQESPSLRDSQKLQDKSVTLDFSSQKVAETQWKPVN